MNIRSKTEEINQFSRSGKAEDGKWEEFSQRVSYQIADATNPESYKEIGKE